MRFGDLAGEEMKKRKPEDLRSARWFAPDDLRSFGHRSRMMQLGMAEEEFRDRPVIGVLSTWSELNTCHAHFPERVKDVKRGVLQAGGLAVEMPALSVDESFTKPTSMLYRNMLAMETEEMIRSHPLDGVVLMGALACGGLDGLQPFAMRLVRLRTFGQWTFERLLALWISTPERFIRGARGCIADARAPLTRERDRHAIEQVRQALAASRTSDIAALVRLLSSSSLSGELGAIRCPCLNIVGSQDRVIHPGHQLRIQRAVPGMSTMLLDGCGHLPMVERPAEVNRVMEAFMALRHLAAHSAGQAAEQESAVELPLASDEKPRDVSIPGPVTDQIGSCAA